MQPDRRSPLKLLRGAALPTLPFAPMAMEDLFLSSVNQNFKRGTTHNLDEVTRSFVIVWQDLGCVKLQAACLVTDYGALRVGPIVDVKRSDHVDFLIAPTTPAVTARAEAMTALGTRIEGIRGARERPRLWSMAGTCTRVDLATNTVSLIGASDGEPGRPSRDRGQVIPMPQIVTEAGKAALMTIKQARRSPPYTACRPPSRSRSSPCGSSPRQLIGLRSPSISVRCRAARSRRFHRQAAEVFPATFF